MAYYYTNSIAILTDALESIVNVIAGCIGLYSLYIATFPKDISHPYGHGKAEFVSAAAEGALIIGAGIFIIYETVQNLIHPTGIVKLDKGLILVGITAVVNFIAGTICLRIGKNNHSLALQASGKHLQIDTYSTVIIIIGLGLMLLTKIFWLDKLLAFVISIIVIYNGYNILRKSLSGIMDEADKELLKKFASVLNDNRQENWVDVHNLRVIKYGSTLHIDCHLTVPWFFNVHEAHKEIDLLTEIISAEFGNTIELFVHTDGCLPISCAICNKKDCEARKQPFKARLNWTWENIVPDKKHSL